MIYSQITSCVLTFHWQLPGSTDCVLGVHVDPFPWVSLEGQPDPLLTKFLTILEFDNLFINIWFVYLIDYLIDPIVWLIDFPILCGG